MYNELYIIHVALTKGLSEQYRYTLATHRVRVFFKGTSTIKSLLMHLKDPIPDAQKTDIIYLMMCMNGLMKFPLSLSICQQMASH